MFGLLRSSVVVAAGLVAFGSSAMGTTVTHLSDDFEAYNTNADLRTAWNNTGLFLGIQGTTANSGAILPLGTKFHQSNNATTYRDLADDVSAEDDWTLSFKVSQNDVARAAQVVWLVDYLGAPGTQGGVLSNGYGVRFDMNTELVRIIRTGTATDPAAGSLIGVGSSLVPPETRTGISLSPSIALGGVIPDTGPLPFYDAKLTWTASTKTLAVYLIDLETPKTTFVETTSITPTFDRVYAIGNGAGWFDDISVTSTVIPEPASLSCVVLGAGGMLLRRRRH
jgi:hypothetical protein